MPRSCLYLGEVMHQRLRPVRHRFVYRVFSLLIDLDEMPALDKRLRLFAHNRFGLAALHDRDHGLRNGAPLRPWVEAQLAQHGIELDGGRIFLLAMPRVLGYGCNPLSIYWCYGPERRLRAVVYEVKNTFGEQHVYLWPAERARKADSPIIHSAAKTFYVSPFIGMRAKYKFRVFEPEGRLAVVIRERDEAGNDILLATHRARREALSDAQLLRACLTLPFVTLKVMAGIHWEALKLWLKGARYHRRPTPPTGEAIL